MDIFVVILILSILIIIIGSPTYAYLMYNLVNNKGLNDAKSLK